MNLRGKSSVQGIPLEAAMEIKERWDRKPGDIHVRLRTDMEGASDLTVLKDARSAARAERGSCGRPPASPSP
jgi:hypothetical protein